MLKKIFAAGVFFFIADYSIAQVDNTRLKETIPVDSSDAGWIKFRFSNDNFLKDNEYFNNIQIGQTYFGTMFNPSLTWNPNQNIRLQGGVFLRRDFGNNSFFQVIPTFTLKFSKNGYSFLFGTLEGSINHDFIQPLYDFERYITDHIENGAEGTFDKPFLKGNIYIDWQHYLYADHPGDQEVINSGFALTPYVYHSSSWQIGLPQQTTIFHHGGQLEHQSYPKDLTMWNYATGISVSYLSPDQFISRVSLDNYFAYYKDLSPTKLQAYTAGHAFYFNALVESKYHAGILLSYWHAHQFISDLGGYLYQSQSLFIPGYAEPDRHLLLATLQYDQRIFHVLDAMIRFEPYYDFINEKLEYSYSAYFIYRTEFRLVKVKHQS